MPHLPFTGSRWGTRLTLSPLDMRLLYALTEFGTVTISKSECTAAIILFIRPKTTSFARKVKRICESHSHDPGRDTTRHQPLVEMCHVKIHPGPSWNAVA